jgi:subtilisin family serine protease
MRKAILGAPIFGVAATVGFSFAGATANAAGQAKRYIVITKAQGSGSTAIGNAVKAAGGAVQTRVDTIGALAVTSDRDDFAAQLKKDARVQYVLDDVEVQWLPDVHAVEANETDLQQQGVNSEQYNAYLWNIRAIGADTTAAAGIQGNTVQRARVAVLDSGLWINHPDLAGNVNAALGQSYVLTPADIDTDDDGVPDTTVPAEPGIEPVVAGFNHGTHVSGIIAAAINTIGAQGVAPMAEIVPFKVLRSTTGSGSFLWVAEGIVDAADVDADVINMSLGATFARRVVGGYGPYIALLTRAINYATQQGTLVVVAAGNEGLDLDSIYWSVPAQLGLGIGVSATGPRNLFGLGENNVDLDRFASYSNFGRSVVSVAAPGGDFSLYPNAAYVYDMVLSPGGRSGTGAYQYFFAAGTSMAAPHVAGLAALIVGEQGKTSPTDLKSMIEQTAVDLYKPGADAWSGRGRIDAARVFGLQ